MDKDVSAVWIKHKEEKPVYIFMLLVLVLKPIAGMQSFTVITNLTSTASIACNDSNQIIKIEGISSEQEPNKCRNTTTNTTLSTKAMEGVMKLCDGRRKCHIGRELVLQNNRDNYGYASLSYSCTYTTDQGCSFDGTSDWCDFLRLDEQSRFTWKLKSKFGFLSSDHTHPDMPSMGKFAYVHHTSRSLQNSTATLVMENKMARPGDRCLVFWYVITDTTHHLEVKVDNKTEHKLYGVQKTWTEEMLTIQGQFQSISFIVFRSSLPFDGQIAIDDVSILNVSCKYREPQVETCIPFSSSFTQICSQPENITISLDPVCNEITYIIQETIYNKCHENATDGECSLNLTDIIPFESDCFFVNSVYVTYTCKDAVNGWEIGDKTESKISLGIFGVSASLICILISIAAYMSIRKGKHRSRTYVIQNEGQDDENNRHESDAVSTNNFLYDSYQNRCGTSDTETSNLNMDCELTTVGFDKTIDKMGVEITDTQ